jgi:MFS family permease
VGSGGGWYAQLMIVLDGTIVNIALPSVQRDLGFANADRQWIISAYALAFGSLLLLGGKLGDLFGRNRGPVEPRASPAATRARKPCPDAKEKQTQGTHRAPRP